MQNYGLYNYQEINSYCKSEGMNTEYFITDMKRSVRRKSRVKLLAMLVAMLKKTR